MLSRFCAGGSGPAPPSPAQSTSQLISDLDELQPEDQVQVSVITGFYLLCACKCRLYHTSLGLGVDRYGEALQQLPCNPSMTRLIAEPLDPNQSGASWSHKPEAHHTKPHHKTPPLYNTRVPHSRLGAQTPLQVCISNRCAAAVCKTPTCHNFQTPLPLPLCSPYGSVVKSCQTALLTASTTTSEQVIVSAERSS